ncbi:MAG TPA: peptide deformylase [Spirochaetota bacterium]|nr:peptide deformylase [Spirochaetota bacterium]
MKKAKIIHFGDPVLRQKAEPVAVFHKKLYAVVDTIKNTLLDTDYAAALAANQVSILKQITVIDYCDEYFEMINPEILESSGVNIGYEGCLSFPGFSGKVKRFENVTVRFFDRYGDEKIIQRSGSMARCIQHELDHLNGILYIDRMVEDFVTHDENNTKLYVADLQQLTAPGRKE